MMQLRYGLCLCLCLGLLALTSACGAPPGPPPELPEARPDQALVVFYRPRSAKGGAIRYRLQDGAGNALGDLTNGTMLHEYRVPGDVRYTVSTPSVAGQAAVDLKVEAGQTDFLRGSVLLGWPAGRQRLEQVGEERAVAEIAKL